MRKNSNTKQLRRHSAWNEWEKQAENKKTLDKGIFYNFITCTVLSSFVGAIIFICNVVKRTYRTAE